MQFEKKHPVAVQCLEITRFVLSLSRIRKPEYIKVAAWKWLAGALRFRFDGLLECLCTVVPVHELFIPCHRQTFQANGDHPIVWWCKFHSRFGNLDLVAILHDEFHRIAGKGRRVGMPLGLEPA